MRSIESTQLRLDLQQSWWAMEGLGDLNGTEWSVEEKFEKLEEAGFSGILGRLPAPEEEERWRRLLDDYGFSFGVHVIPFTGPANHDIGDFLSAAKRFGVSYVNAQVLDHTVVGEEAITVLKSLLDQSLSADMPLYVETHRGRITQDPLRTLTYLNELPNLQLTIDFSHYVLGAALDSPHEATEALFASLLCRTASIHGRISNGHQIQVDVEEGDESSNTSQFRRWWTAGMEHWIRNSLAASASQPASFPFVSEFGPPPYALQGRHGPSPADRWRQSKLLREIGIQSWEEALRTSSLL